MIRPLSDGPLPHMALMDCGMAGYHEFACSRATFEALAAGAMKVLDGRPVRVRVIEECVGGHNVIVQVNDL